MPNVVFFGGADYGKSTVIGYMYANTQHGINIESIEKELKIELGSKYKPDYLYPSFVNSRIVESIERGERGNSKMHEFRNITIDGSKITMIDTPGQEEYFSERQLGMSMSDIGIFCFAIEKVLADNFKGATFEYSELYSQFHPNGKLIYLLTMFDLPIANYEERNYRIACEKIKQHCKWVDITYVEDVFGSPLPLSLNEIDAAAIIPVAVEFNTKEKEGINIFSYNKKTSWYEGPTLVEAIRKQIYDLTISQTKFV